MIVILMIIVVVAPGNYARMSDTTQFHRPASMVEWIKGLVHAGTIYHYFLLFYLPYYMVLMALSYLMGVKAKINKWFRDVFDNKKHIIIGIMLLYAIYIFCTILPSVFLYGNFGIQRNYTHTVFMTMLTLCAMGFVFGYWTANVERVLKYVSVVGLLALFSIMLINCRMDFSVVKAYAESVDNRIMYCYDMQNKGSQSVLEVEPLNEPVTVDAKYMLFHMMGKTNLKPILYYISDTEETPNEYAYHMKRVYKWDFDIVLKQQ
jgi:NADH:ubiquinone oxidoreductase subunit 6 (subunit J)